MGLEDARSKAAFGRTVPALPENVADLRHAVVDLAQLVLHAEIVREREILITVIDQGQGMTPRPDSSGLGLGLPLIANLADRLEIHDGSGGVGTELTMAF